MKKVLSTKTLGQDILDYAQTKHLEVKCVDFIETTPFPFKFEHLGNRHFDALAFTSANAVKYFFENNDAASYIAGKQVFAIQGKTQEELAARGIQANITGASAEELGDAIAFSAKAKTVLHVCGNLRLPVLENKLNAAGIFYTDLMVYQTGTKAKKVSDQQMDAVMFYSPSGVESFFVMNTLHNETVCCCIGNTTAQALNEKKNDAIIILPEQPSPQSMLSALAGYFSNGSENYTHFKYHHQS